MLKISKIPLRNSKKIALFTAAVAIFLSSVFIVFRPNSQTDSVLASSCDIFQPIDSLIMSRINSNKSVYQQVANETGVPWEVLAAVHYREFNNRRDINPYNNQGIYQMYSIYQKDARYKRLADKNTTVTNENFLEQTRYAADFIQDKARGNGTPIVTPRKLTANETDLNLIKNTLFSYNGRAYSYAQQAQVLGFNRTNQPFEGSPYVMNKFDCKRTSMNLITADGSNDANAKDTRLGAFTLFARLKGDSYWTSLQIDNLPGCAEATNTTVSCVWRVYNQNTKKYTYTVSFEERNRLVAQGYSYEGVAFFANNPVAQRAGNIPIYELRNNQNGSLLTANKVEYDTLKRHGWKDKGIAFYGNPSDSNAGYNVHRFYNSTTGAHAFAHSATDINKLRSSGFASEGVAFSTVTPRNQATAAPSGQVNVYRFGSMPGNTHFWTTDLNERDSMIRGGYRYEGIAWRAYRNTQSANISKPVYRLYSAPMKKHLFTADTNERDVLNRTSSWKSEGIAFHAAANNTGKPVHRIYLNSNHAHLFSTDTSERNALVRTGIGRDEGAAWYQP